MLHMNQMCDKWDRDHSTNKAGLDGAVGFRRNSQWETADKVSMMKVRKISMSYIPLTATLTKHLAYNLLSFHLDRYK
jgi:hypothetical protein